eukprot:CAMPEP_0178406632 /NCGR_PEP_ID=MMETSP0689_2-20121128/19012_1 /TAXON_ID=160604 /ORGANISM="Amphidinium massartii, Strain CS-259" /LENGTH=497 /DNA_ID=CAMNT_0020027679 /DNA_START=76 /DNA_END=1569 /DNA_ORIENTATION=+
MTYRNPLLLLLLAVSAAMALQSETNHSADFERLSQQVQEMEHASYVNYKLIATALVFLMQIGFAFLETGYVHYMSANLQLLKNLTDICATGMAWMAVGSKIACLDYDSPVDWGYAWVFAATAGTIVSGSVAGRMHPYAYIVYNAINAAVLYPTVVALMWGEGREECLPIIDAEFHDFAGCGVVHLFGGFCSLSAVLFTGPRSTKEEPCKAVQPHNTPVAVLGHMLLFVGWFGFNPGSLARDEFPDGNLVGRILRNTVIGGSSGGAIAFIYGSILPKLLAPGGQSADLLSLGNGILAGLVAVTGSCDMDEVGYAMATLGCVGSLACFGTSKLLRSTFCECRSSCSCLQTRRKETVVVWWLEDTVDAVGVHGAAGMVGLLLPCAFHPNDIRFPVQLKAAVIICSIGFFGSSVVFALMRIKQDACTSGVCGCPEDVPFPMTVKQTAMDSGGADKEELGIVAYGLGKLSMITDEINGAPIGVQIRKISGLEDRIKAIEQKL